MKIFLLQRAALACLISAPAVLAQAPARPANYPPDIYADSGFRLPLPKRDQLDELGKKAYDDAAPGGRTVAGLRGPLGIRLYSPHVADLTNALSRYLRYDSGLDPALRELIILATGRELGNQFEWAAHEPVARKEGLSQAAIDVVKLQQSTSALPEKQALIIDWARQIFRTHKLSADTFAAARKAFGERDLVNIASLMGAYASTAILIETFDLQLEPGQTPPLP
jgi:4-carboxymuconolactone decarboxylase